MIRATGRTGLSTATAVTVPALDSDGIEHARRRLAGRLIATPVVRSAELDRLAGARLWLKAENLQHGGSFKIRGALLATEQLAWAGARGVIAQSTGNHAIAVARAAHQHRLPAVVVLPVDVTATKVRQVREAGAEVILAGTLLTERMAVVEELRAARRFEVLDPYENPLVVVGQGTAAAELVDQVTGLGGRLDGIVLPVGGGSLVAGACLATGGRDIDVVAAEPAAVPALTDALRAGRPVTVEARSTIADGLRPDRIGRLPFRLCRAAVASVVTVSEAAIAEAMYVALMHARLLIEPAAATALAVALGFAGGSGYRSADVGVVLTGGNVEPGLLASVLAERAVR